MVLMIMIVLEAAKYLLDTLNEVDAGKVVFHGQGKVLS